MKSFALQSEHVKRDQGARSSAFRLFAPTRTEQARVRQLFRPNAGTALFKKGTSEGGGTAQKAEAAKPAGVQKATGLCGAMASCPEEKCAEMKPALEEAKAMVARAKADLAPGARGGWPAWSARPRCTYNRGVSTSRCSGAITTPCSRGTRTPW